jgi:hypothetical protein
VSVATPAADIARLDAALRHLDRVLDSSQVAAVFADRLARRTLRRASLQHVRWRPGTDCVTVHRLEYAGRDGSGGVTLVAARADTEGVRTWEYTDDPELSGASPAGDPAVSGPWLEARTGLRGAWTVTPLRYRPGRRCVLRYEHPASGTVVYGKVLAGDGDTAAAPLHAALPGVAVALVAANPAWGLVVLADGGESSLRSLLGGPGATAQAHGLAGTLLARLHRASMHGTVCRALGDDVQALAGDARTLERACPQAASAFARAVELLRSEDVDGFAVAPAHGGFRLDQVHLSNAGPLMIDLDTFCNAERERDAANLLAYLRWRALRGKQPPGDEQRAREAFLSAYTAGAAALDPSRLALYEAASLLKIATRRCRALATEQWSRLPELVRAALTLIDAGTL